MTFVFVHLDVQTRELMFSEADGDRFTPTEYYSRRLSATGLADWPLLLRTAIQNGDASTLAADLRQGGRLKDREERKTKNGIKLVDVPVNAADILTQGEFNRYYIRALCMRVLTAGGTDVVVCRGRHSENPRPESEAILGKAICARTLHADIRSNPGQETLLGIPLVNSGLTVRLPS